MKRFLPEDLLEYHYGELSTEDRRELREALKENWALREKLDVIKQAAQRLEKSIAAPREESVEFILRYAATHSSATTI